MALRQLLSDLSDPSTPVDSSAYPTQNEHLEAVTFNQRSFKFGEGRAFDRTGLGFSREPFIGNPRALLGSKNQEIPEAEDSQNKLKGLGFIDGVTDGLVRGGIVTALSRSTTDFTRLTNFYLSNRGIGFLIKQTALQATNPAIEDGGEAILGLRRNRQFNPLGTNLLAQSLVNFSGVHFDRAGLLPIWPEDAKYEKIVSNPNKANNIGNLNTFTGKTNTFEGNRLLTLFGAHIQDDEVQGVIANNESEPETNLGKLWNKGKDFVQSITGKNSPMLYEYGAGPGSTYGIGRTSIRRFENTTNPDDFPDAGYNTKRLGDQFNGPIRAAKVENYLKTLGRPGALDYQEDAGGGRQYYRESRIGTGNPGVEYLTTGRNPHISQDTYDVYDETTADKINMLDIFKGDGNFFVPEARDLIRFRFEAMDNDNPTKSNAMIFRAFLDDLKDNYNANYNEFNYNGRGENFYTYSSFKRDIQFNFKVAAQTRHEMMPLYRKLNYLVAQTAPEYKKGRMRAGFVRLSIGSWCDRIPGFIQSINLSWQKDYPWEIAIDSGIPGASEGQDKGMLVLPHVLDVSVSFLPVHNFIPQRDVKDSPFILSHENNRRLNEEQKWYQLNVANTSAEAVRLGYDRLREQILGPIQDTHQIKKAGPTYIESPESQVTPQLIRSNTPIPPTQAEIQQQQDQQLEDEANRYGVD